MGENEGGADDVAILREQDLDELMALPTASAVADAIRVKAIEQEAS
jgi:hypothetical protein